MLHPFVALVAMPIRLVALLSHYILNQPMKGLAVPAEISPEDGLERSPRPAAPSGIGCKPHGQAVSAQSDIEAPVGLAVTAAVKDVEVVVRVVRGLVSAEANIAVNSRKTVLSPCY